MIRKILTGKAIASIGVVTLISAGDPDRPARRRQRSAGAFQALTDAATAAGQSVADCCADAVPGGTGDSPSATDPGKPDSNPSATAPGKP